MDESSGLLEETEKYFKKVFKCVFHEILFLIESRYLGFFTGNVPESTKVQVDLNNRVKIQCVELFKVFITFTKNFVDVVFFYKSMVDILSKIIVKDKPSRIIDF